MSSARPSDRLVIFALKRMINEECPGSLENILVHPADEKKLAVITTATGTVEGDRRIKAAVRDTYIRDTLKIPENKIANLTGWREFHLSISDLLEHKLVSSEATKWHCLFIIVMSYLQMVRECLVSEPPFQKLAEEGGFEDKVVMLIHPNGDELKYCDWENCKAGGGRLAVAYLNPKKTEGVRDFDDVLQKLTNSELESVRAVFVDMDCKPRNLFEECFSPDLRRRLIPLNAVPELSQHTCLWKSRRRMEVIASELASHGMIGFFKTGTESGAGSIIADMLSDDLSEADEALEYFTTMLRPEKGNGGTGSPSIEVTWRNVLKLLEVIRLHALPSVFRP